MVQKKKLKSGKTDPWGSRCRSKTSGKFVKRKACETRKRKK